VELAVLLLPQILQAEIQEELERLHLLEAKLLRQVEAVGLVVRLAQQMEVLEELLLQVHHLFIRLRVEQQEEMSRVLQRLLEPQTPCVKVT
jgi:hypothetical protein